MTKYLEVCVELAIRFRFAVLLAILIVTAVAGFAFKDAYLNSTLKGLFFSEDHVEYAKYERRTKEWGADETLLIAAPIQANDSTVFPRLKIISDELEALDFIHRATSVATISRVELAGDTIEVKTFAEQSAAGKKNEVLFQTLWDDPIVQKRLLSDIGKDEFWVTIVIEYSAVERAGESGPGNILEIKKIFQKNGFDSDKLKVAGLPGLMAELISESYRNLGVVLPMVLGALMLGVLLMFRRFWPVFVTTLSAAISVVWTAGAAIYYNPAVDVMMTVLPCLVMIISFSDVVHICSAYLVKLERGATQHTAIVQATAEVGAACLLTSLSTAIGFLALVFVPTPVFQKLGVISALGVVLAYLIALFLVPIVLHFLPIPKENKQAKPLPGAGLLNFCMKISTEQPKKVVGIFAAIFVLLIIGLFQVQVETVFAKRLAKTNPVRMSQTFFDETFSGSSGFNVYVDTKVNGGVLDEKFFERLMAFEKEVEALDDVVRLITLADLMKTTHEGIVGKEGKAFEPKSNALAQIMVLLEMPGPDSMSDIVDFKRKSLRLTVITKDRGAVAESKLRDEIQRISQTHFIQEDIDLLGISPMLGAWIDDIVRGQKTGVFASLFLISILLMFAFRSIRVGLLSMIPNVFPILAILGFVGFTWDFMDSDTLIILMIAVGIGVDDTIHFLSRMQFERERGVEKTAALQATFDFAGLGILITTFVFVIGFLPMVQADYFVVEAMGYLLPLCFVSAFLADVLLLPAMIQLGWIDFKEKKA